MTSQVKLADLGVFVQRWQPGATVRIRCPQTECAAKRKTNLAVTIDPDGRGATFVCHRCGWTGGVHDAAERLVSTSQPKLRAVKAKLKHVTLSDYGRALWDACKPITGSDDAGRYLINRRCGLPHHEGDLRWHPKLKHPSGYVGPALVALVTNATNADHRMTLHRTWIKPDGKKADVDPPRLLLKDHTKKGGVIRLWPDCEVTLGLGLGEGVESSLTLARGFTPVWATIDANNMASLPYVYPIEALTVAVDNDPNGKGLEAFETMARRWWYAALERRGGNLPGSAAPIEIRKVIPPRVGSDINDWVRSIDNAR